MGLFHKRIDIKNATKTTYSEDDLKKMDLNYTKEFSAVMNQRIYSPIRKEMPRALITQIRDKAFEKILDDHLFTFKHLLVIPNPYGAAVQTALLLFNSSNVCKVRYRILGKDGASENDFCGETDYTDRHRVPVLGLYKGYTNKLVLELVDEDGVVFQRRDLSIYARDIELNLQNIVTKVQNKEASTFPFILVNGMNFNPIAIDQRGEVRYAMQLKTNKLGMIPLPNGNFLFADTSANCVDIENKPIACLYHEIDYMGRIYRTFLMEYPIGRAIAQNQDSLFLVTASDENHEGDCIVEMDMNSGNIVKKCNLVDILGEKYQDRKTWATVTSMEYQDGGLFVTLKRLHTILKLDWNSMKPQWAMAPASVWEDTPVASVLLHNETGEEAISLLPEQSSIYHSQEGKLQLLIYGIQNLGNVFPKEVDHSSKSRILLCEITEDNRTFRLVEKLDTVKAKRFIHAVDSKENHRMLSVCGMLDKRTENCKGVLEEIDIQTGHVINRMELCRTFRQAWVFEPDLAGYAVPLEKNIKVIHGQMTPPAEFSGKLPEASDKKLRKRIFGQNRLVGSLLLFAIYPGTVQHVYLVGKTHSYVQDYTMLELSKRRQSFAIDLSHIAIGEYLIYVEYDGNLYLLKNEIRVEEQ